MVQKTDRHLYWPRPVDVPMLGGEERVNMAIEMSSVIGEIMLDSIRDQYPHISERRLLNTARRRIEAGRRLH